MQRIVWLCICLAAARVSECAFGSPGTGGNDPQAPARMTTTAAADRARALLAAGDFDGAVFAARDGVVEDPADIECRVIRTTLNLAMWDSSGNRAAYTDLHYLFDLVGKAREAAWRLAAEPDPEDAWDRLDPETKANLDERFVRLALPEALQEAGRLTDAKRQQARFSERYPEETGWICYTLGAICSQALRGEPYGPAREAFLHLLRQAPEDIPLRWLLALSLQEGGNHNAATIHFERLVGLTAEPVGWLHHAYAKSLLFTGRAAQAVQHGRIASDRVKSFVTLELLFHSLMAAGEREEAIEVFRELVPFFNDRADWALVRELTAMCRALGIGPEEARPFFDDMIGQGDEHSYRLRIAGEVFRDLGYRTAALEALLDAAKTSGSRDRAMALNLAGRLVMDTTVPGVNPADGLAYLREAADLGCADAMAALGFFYDAGRVVERDRNRGRDYYAMAIERGCYTSMGNILGPLEDNIQSMLLGRWAVYLGCYNAYNNVAYTMLSVPELWDPERAARYVEYALSQDQRGTYLNTLYRVHERIGDWQQADMAWRRWEHWWRGQRDNRDRELPERWAERRNRIDEELAKLGLERGAGPLTRQAPAFPDWPDPGRTWGPPRPVAPVPENSPPAVPLRLVRREREAPTPEQWAWVQAARLLHVGALMRDLEEEPSHGQMNRFSDWFAYWWRVFDRRDFWELMQAHELEGDRTRFDQLAAHWLPPDPERWAARLRDPNADVEELHAIRVVLDHGEEAGARSILAYDLVTYIGRTVRGRLAGFITAEEARGMIMPAARLLQETFDSWEDMGRNYLAGHRFAWFRRPPGYRQLTDLWLRFDSLLRDEDSPWLNIPWDLDLDPPAAGSAGEAAGGTPQAHALPRPLASAMPSP